MAKEREVDLSDRMSEHEALMWNVEKDPWLNPNGAALTTFDGELDMDIVRRAFRHGAVKMPRLYQRVVPGLARLSTPGWAPDAEFDFGYHLREIRLPAPGTKRQLLDLATRLYEEPLDRTRPLWRIVVISGYEGDRSAIYSLIHHAVSDGIGQLRIAELYQQLSKDEEPKPEVDLEGIVAAAVEAHEAKEQGGDLSSSLRDTASKSLSHLVRRQAGIARSLAAEVVLWPADPDRARGNADDAINAAKGIVGQFQGLRDDDEEKSGSPLWAGRSRHRRLEHVRVAVDELKGAAKALGGSINDAFLLGMTEGASRYHAERGTKVDGFNTSFVISTRKDDKMGGNSFTPVLIRVEGGELSLQQRMDSIRATVETAKEDVESGGGLGGLSGVINLLPTSVVTRVAKEQAAKIDFATSNLRGAPFDLYCGGVKVDETICMGPVAGTAANITALSASGNFDIGMFIDPEAIDDPEGYRRAVEEAFAAMISETGSAVKPSSASASKRSTDKGKSKSKKKAVAAKSVKPRSNKKPTKKKTKA